MRMILSTPTPPIRTCQRWQVRINLLAVAVALAPVTGGLAPAIANPPAPAPGGAVLLLPGAEGNEVAMVQRQMRLLGLYQGPMDGRYSEATQEAIAQFQASAGLSANGVLDQATWQKMITPQLLGNEPRAEAEPPVLFANAPAAQGTPPESPDAAAPSPASPTDAAPVDDSSEPPTAAPSGTQAPENSSPAQDSPAETNSRRWLLSGLALVLGVGLVGLVGRFLLGRRPAADPASLATAPPDPAVAPPPLTPPPADLPLETTSRLSAGDVVDRLVSDLSHGDGAVRRHAIWELGQRGNSSAIQPLVDGLLGADSQEKSLILAALAEISSRSLKPMHRALALGLQDPSPEVRKNAIRDLSRVYDTVVQLSHMLAHASQDPDPAVQETAQWALGQLNRIPAAPYSAALPPQQTYDGDRLPPG